MKKSNPASEKILNAAQTRMVRFGYHKVTMDEIASDVRMSKHTIYMYFPSKIEIAKGLVTRIKAKINDNRLRIEKTEKDPLKVLSLNLVFLQQEISPWYECFLRDIQFELPELWQDFVGFYSEKIMDMEKIVVAGIKRGIFRPVNPTLAVRAHLGAVKDLMNPETLHQVGVTFQEALDFLYDIWLKGIVKDGKR